MINPELLLNLPDFFIRDSILSFLPVDNLMRLVTAIGKPPPPSDDTNSLTIRRLLVITKDCILVRNEKIVVQLEGMKEDLLVDFLNKHFTALADSGITTFFKTARQCCVILAYMEDAIKNRCKGNKMMWPVGLGELLMYPHVGRRTPMTFWVLISSPLKWNPSLIAQIETGWWQGDTIVSYVEREEDLYVTDHKFIGLVTHLEGGGDLIYYSDGARVSGFAHTDRTVGERGFYNVISTCYGVENQVTLLTHGLAEYSRAYALFRQSPAYAWVGEEKVQGRNFICLWDWTTEQEADTDEAAVFEFMTTFVHFARFGLLRSPFHK
jgi:hypothetical protein